MTDTKTIVSGEPMTVGARHRGPTTDWHRESHDVTFVVLREVTKAEYDACLARHGVNPDEEPPFFEPVWFYDVLMD